MKGISAIIATLLLLVITMGLSVTAYFYINNLITGRTNKVLSVLDASCVNGQIVLVVTNEGTNSIPASDVKLIVGTQAVNVTFNPNPLPPRSTAVITYGSGLRGPQTLTIVTPSGTSKPTVYC